jgi:hypothetical protein
VVCGVYDGETATPGQPYPATHLSSTVRWNRGVVSSTPTKKSKNRRKSKRQTKRKSNRQRNHVGVKHSNTSVRQSLGSQIGAGIGNWAEKSIRSLFGSGDYGEEHAKSGLEVEANSIVQPMTAAQVPIFSTPEHLHGAVRVAHREYIGDIATGEFLGSDWSATYPITPRNPQLFPWLSVIAQNFQQWVPCGIVVEFVSTCGNAFSGASAALGDVNMAVEYDIEAPPYLNKNQMLNAFYSVSAATSQNLMMAVECAPEDQVVSNYFLQEPGRTPFYDARLNVLGDLRIRNTGSQSVYTAGQLWVTYEIILLKPRVYQPPLTVEARFSGHQLALLEMESAILGRPLTAENMATLTALPKPQEEKKREPTVLDVLSNLTAEGVFEDGYLVDHNADHHLRSSPINIPSPPASVSRYR